MRNKILLLIKNYKTSDTNLEKLNISLKISYALERNKPDEALSYAQSAYLLAFSLGEKELMIDSLILQANILKNIGQATKALKKLAQAETKAKKYNYKVGLGLILSAQGYIAYRQGQSTKGIVYCKKALKMLQEEKYLKGIAKANANLGGVYFGSSEFEKSIPYSLKAVEIYDEINDDNNRLIPFYNLAAANISLNRFEVVLPMIDEGIKLAQQESNQEIEANFHNLLGAYYFELQDFEEAINYFNQSLTIREAMKSWDYLGMSIANLGSAFRNFDQIEKAIELNNLGLSYIDQIESPHVLATIYSSIAYTKEYLEDWNAALENHQKALVFAQESDNKEQQRQATQDISAAYENKNDFKNALIYYKRFKILNDDIFAIEKEKIILKLEKRLKVKENEALLLVEQSKSNALKKENKDIINQKNILESEVKKLVGEKLFETNSCGILSLDDIIYLAADGEKTKIYTTNQTEPLSETQMIGELEIQLPKEQFFRIHKSYIINGYFLARKNSQKYFLKTGFEINTSRKYKPDLSTFLNKK
jgi:tetratricopeptide (TPR) repeat protein